MNVEKSKEFVRSSFTSKFTEKEQNEIEPRNNYDKRLFKTGKRRLAQSD